MSIALKEPLEVIQTNRSIVGSKYYTHVLPRLEEVYRRLSEWT